MEENIMNGKVLWNAKGEKTVPTRKPAGRGQAARRALMTAGAIVGVVFLIGGMVVPLCAQPYPNKPIRLIETMSAGGAVDILGRVIAMKFPERLGQPVLVENRSGAGGNIGLEFVAKARPDGYTLALGAATLATAPSLYKKLNYDPIKDLAPIALLSRVPMVIIVPATLPVKNLKEFVEYVRANPGKLNFASAGVGAVTHLGSELLISRAKLKMVHVPYKGGGPALIGLLGGEVQMYTGNPSTAMAQIQAGQVKALAVLGDQRLRSLPDVPTAKEGGIDNCEATSWHGMLAPGGTPRDIINRLNAEWIRMVAMPDIKEKLENAGLMPVSGTPEQYSEFIKAESEQWAKVVKEANIPKIN